MKHLEEPTSSDGGAPRYKLAKRHFTMAKMGWLQPRPEQRPPMAEGLLNLAVAG